MKSKFPSKQPCYTCGAQWSLGTEIYHIKEKYYCSNPQCGISNPSSVSPQVKEEVITEVMKLFERVLRKEALSI